MKLSTRTLLSGAALAGLISGSVTTVTAATSTTTLSKAGQVAGTVADKTHACAGKNSCKGKGGCKTGDNGCKGKNSCKGKGGCATDGCKAPE